MSTFDTLVLWFGAAFICWTLGNSGLDLPLLTDGVRGLQEFFASSKQELDVTLLEDIWGVVESLLGAAHDAFSSAAEGALRQAS